MSLYEETLKKITPKDTAIGDAIAKKWEANTPYGSYGKLADMVGIYAMATNELPPRLPKPCRRTHPITSCLNWLITG